MARDLLTPSRIVRVGLLALGMLASCRACDDVPNAGMECVSETLVPAGAFPEQPSCTRCIEEKCCDAVGFCKDDESCTKAFKEMHACVLTSGGARGGAAEPGCLSALARSGAGRERAEALYSCMRGSCGRECALPICRLDTTVTFIENFACDTCFGLACCSEINECMTSRRCRLTIECLVKECRGELEKTLNAAAFPEASMLEVLFCGGADAGRVGPPDDDDDDGGRGAPCTDNCVSKYLFAEGQPGPTEDAGFATEEIARARCLASRVRACGARADCGSKCRIDGGRIVDAGGDSD